MSAVNFHLQKGDDEENTTVVAVKDVELAGRRFSFKVNRMNVQGGGTVLFRDILASLEWQESAPKDYYFHPPTDGEPVSQEYQAVERDELWARRNESIDIVNSGEKKTFSKAAQDKVNDHAALRKQLLCTPFPLLARVLTDFSEFLETRDEDEDGDLHTDDEDLKAEKQFKLVQMIAETVIELSKDVEWLKVVEEKTELSKSLQFEIFGVEPQDANYFDVLTTVLTR